ncbi:hypothetical protein MG293_009526 [Ovis ammon polii]|uniref:Uncharacterized protein n=1 Tax=Ovis ammon polii TaxID=230172 RepID=A0AAD4UBG1_OVIAM|nr:hypothetical protein MG293_009526 [Ovis ammon polii]
MKERGDKTLPKVQQTRLDPHLTSYVIPGSAFTPDLNLVLYEIVTTCLAQLGRRNEIHTRTRGPKVTATANLPGLIPISRNAQQRGGKPCLSLGLERKWKEAQEQALSPIAGPIGDASRATTELVRELLRIKIPLLPPVRFSKPTTQKPRPDNCRGGAAELKGEDSKDTRRHQLGNWLARAEILQEMEENNIRKVMLTISSAANNGSAPDILKLKPVSLQGPQPALALSCSFLPETCPSPSTPDRNTVKDILEKKYPEIDSSNRHQSVLFAETGLRLRKTKFEDMLLEDSPVGQKTSPLPSE